jgi:hypothetical protein
VDAQQGYTSKSAMPLLLTQEPVKAYYPMQYMKMEADSEQVMCQISSSLRLLEQ